MGILNIFKKSRRQINRENQSQGKEGKRIVKRDLEMQGYKVQRTGRGHDFKATKENILTGKKESKYIQVKTGNSPLSKLQKQKKRQFGTRFVEKRLEPTGLGLIKKDRHDKSVSWFTNPKKSSGIKKRTDSWGAITSAKKPAVRKKSIFSVGGFSTSAKKPAVRKKSIFSVGGFSTSAKKPATRKKSTSGMWGFSTSAKKPATRKKSTFSVGGFSTSAKKPATRKKSTFSVGGFSTSAKKPVAKKKSTSGMWGSSRSSRKSKKKGKWDF